jgi:hypothetical protein
MGQRAVSLLALMLVSGLASEAARCAQMPSAVQYALHCSGCHGLQGHGLAANGNCRPERGVALCRYGGGQELPYFRSWRGRIRSER